MREVVTHVDQLSAQVDQKQYFNQDHDLKPA